MKTVQLPKKKILLVGAGQMARDYFNVLKSMKMQIEVVCRSAKSAKDFKEDTGHDAISGGLEKYLQGTKTIPDYVILAVDVSNLTKLSISLINNGARNILIEKPAAKSLSEIDHITNLVKRNKVNAFVAYNRRFYSSVLMAKEIIAKDGGISSFTFEFTEWSHIIEKLNKEKSEMERWFISNSSHVADLAFYLGGYPKEFNSFSLGEGNLEWHPSASVFTGSGITNKNILFSYHADWESAGRWGIELLTKRHRLILKPLEKLQIQKIGSIEIDYLEIDDQIDQQFKPGLFRQVEAFIGNESEEFCTVEDQKKLMELYYQISNYS